MYKSNPPGTCRGCGSRFEGRPWQALCWHCWRERRDREAQREAYQIGFRDGLASAQRVEIDQELLRRLIVFAHPDRHPQRFEEANKLTAELLALRRGLVAA